jgi:hypothetical protein
MIEIGAHFISMYLYENKLKCYMTNINQCCENRFRQRLARIDVSSDWINPIALQFCTFEKSPNGWPFSIATIN